MTDQNIFSEVHTKLINHLMKIGISNKKVLDVLSLIPRHLFVEPALQKRAYDDDALPIGYNQTISSPSIVAKMTQLIFEEDRMTNVLEIGTGCGYQTSILSKLFSRVTTIERIKSLHDNSKRLLEGLSYKNITFIHGDGFKGYKNNSPYDAIIMTASPSEIPSELVNQLKLSGRMVLPLNVDGSQKLLELKILKMGY